MTDRAPLGTNEEETISDDHSRITFRDPDNPDAWISLRATDFEDPEP